MKDFTFTYIGKTKDNKQVGCIGIFDFYQTKRYSNRIQL